MTLLTSPRRRLSSMYSSPLRMTMSTPPTPAMAATAPEWSPAALTTNAEWIRPSPVATSQPEPRVDRPVTAVPVRTVTPLAAAFSARPKQAS